MPIAIVVVGLDLAVIYPKQFELTFGLSMASFGIGFFLFLFVGSLVYHRYVLESLPAGPFAATSFLATAPTAIMAIVLFKLMILVQQGVPIPLSTEAVGTLSALGILFTWGFAAWAFIMAAVIGLSSIKSLSVPYALSRWAVRVPIGRTRRGERGGVEGDRFRQYPVVLLSRVRTRFVIADSVHNSTEWGSGDVVIQASGAGGR